MKWNLKATGHWAVRAVSSLVVAVPITQSHCKDDKKDSNKDNQPHDVAVYLSNESRAALKSHLGWCTSYFMQFSNLVNAIISKIISIFHENLITWYQFLTGKFGVSGDVDTSRVIIRRSCALKDSFYYEPIYGEKAAYRLKGIIRTEGGAIAGVGRVSSFTGLLVDDDCDSSLPLQRSTTQVIMIINMMIVAVILIQILRINDIKICMQYVDNTKSSRISLVELQY
jgi:hypothetical protein